MLENEAKMAKNMLENEAFWSFKDWKVLILSKKSKNVRTKSLSFVEDVLSWNERGLLHEQKRADQSAGQPHHQSKV